MKNTYTGPERREFFRLDYTTPLAFKICKKKTISRLLQGYTVDISPVGLQCRLEEKVRRDDVLWLSFDRSTLHICEELENKALIYQNGVIGKVVWAGQEKEGRYQVGIKFLTREEKNLTNIYPKAYFIMREQEKKK